MLNNKLYLIGFLGFHSLLCAQTIDSLTELQNALPVPTATTAGQTVQTEEIKLIAIYHSKNHAQAQLLVNGINFYFGVGDIMFDGWEMVKITPNEATLKKCTAAKKCKTKKLVYLGK